ncbi:TIGR03621 family F420-dependent LLM class oxidoreductase [Amycolatopsis sp. PS_44_ISF1]|uniref:TIGR03621 family F420-dependent LLM class oxidoreductase n=1 Tax=Amycolatopsis sp. PS_44_ISF1 TaxID=2974917 RepID=UPI0028DFE65A|nr:TIGR03621 family F420-dependent LLM class oxidoreductase [Amycolatopsis sp. PS_44_ISF1]MDT8913189.1 TIGR03621 family F420-dependent LLM class oxidoreductase [Amycolatopsis sp. PS_44_ISF1]
MRPFRFGVNLTALGERDSWLAQCRTAEQLGYDVLTVSDHLGGQSPFPALAAAAAVTERVRLGTFVLNCAFWNPVLLAREVFTAGRLTGGRLELGLGTGYVRSEFDRAGLEWGTAGQRVDRLAATVAELVRLLDHPRELGVATAPPRPTLVLGGNGDRVLELAARYADVVSFSAAVLKPGATRGSLELLDAEAVQERTEYFARAAGDRAAAVERNVLAQTVVVTDDPDAAIAALRRRMPKLTGRRLADVPTVLVGSPAGIADRLRERRERYGISYVCVQESVMYEFAPVVALLSGR